MEQQTPSLDEVQREAFKSLQRRFRDAAFHHLGSISGRTLTVLQDLELYKDPVENPLGGEMDVDILRNSRHPSRIPLPFGPLLLYASPSDAKGAFLVELFEFLLSPLPEVRKAVLQELQRMISSGEIEVLPNTHKAVEDTHARIASDVPAEWRKAAVTLTDALNEDALVSLQGVMQALACNPVAPDVLKTYANRVLHPSVASIGSVQLDVRAPEQQHSQLAKVISDAVDSSSCLREACSKFYARIGFLPLAPIYALPEVVRLWMAKHSGGDAWSEVWEWARNSHGPIPVYHACTVFVVHPELIPPGQLPKFWEHITSVIGSFKDSPENAAWMIRRDLVRHFAHHFEARLPERDSEPISCISWWFAARVAALFPDKPESLAFYRKNWVAGAAAQSMNSWIIGYPACTPSLLRRITCTVVAPWATSLLSIMSGKYGELALCDQTEEVQRVFKDAMLSCMYGSIPFASDIPSDPTYALELPLGKTALAWAAHQPAESRASIEHVISISKDLSTTEGLCSALQKLKESSPDDQFATAFALHARAHMDTTIADTIWPVLSESEWRRSVLGSINPGALGLLVAGISLIAVSARGKWLTHWPHFIVELCEQAADDDRRRELFLYVIHASLISDTVSAIRRLLHGENSRLYTKAAEEYATAAESVWTQHPGWIQGRTSAILAALRLPR